MHNSSLFHNKSNFFSDRLAYQQNLKAISSGLIPVAVIFSHKKAPVNYSGAN
ncbi:hypothetical protein MuYL_4639 [Mucilaginibacter xinganensis]|uniref:Uncharacterized protein n=1 Tax=Mucilaginibacter xinganensis TaxID=1234841 RepID=A0A223P361_9SPHI|nr:hypothetical protein MuYL_4639 [Mucilaginibacter xinganensis]